MRFQIPQFIETEDKIVGPLSLKQAGFLGAGILFFLVVYGVFGTAKAVLLGLPVALVSFAMAFVKVNGRPFEFFVKNFFKFNFQEHIFVWHKPEQEEKSKKMREVDEISRRYAKKDTAGSGMANLAAALNLHHENNSEDE